ncbi:Metalloprotease LoiP precursor [Marinibacterium anthonyi]|nr:Metalloprotease LoiP precursor [Marinibacterium anthonyi]
MKTGTAHRPKPDYIGTMIKLTPILLAVIYGIIAYQFSVWKTRGELDQKSTELADPRLKRILARMARALGVDRIRVFIYEIDPVNGLAAPDGRIFITRGFYAKFASGEVTEEELASVIAHELGHVALGHSRRRMIDFSGQNALRTALGMILSRFIPGFGIMIAGAVSSLLAATLSRSDEYEADAYAAALLTKAGIGIGPQKSLFRKLDQLTAQRAGVTPAWLMSHPQTHERIAALEKLEARWIEP